MPPTAAGRVVPLLDNPAENPCFGCGPHHARGLHLRFERQKGAEGVEEITCTYEPREDEIGWPGLLHTGLHFTILFEASYWAVWELTGRVFTASGPQTFDQTRLPRVGHAFTARARLVATPDGSIRTRATSHTHEGKLAATLETGWRPASRAVMARAGLRLPAYLMDDMAP